MTEMQWYTGLIKNKNQFMAIPGTVSSTRIMPSSFLRTFFKWYLQLILFNPGTLHIISKEQNGKKAQLQQHKTSTETIY